MPLPHTLILGYGNIDRQDDGVAWHIVEALARRLGHPTGILPESQIDLLDRQVRLQLALQLTPEMAETISTFERVCFVDAHTGEVPENLAVRPVDAHFQSSPFTHHLTPASLLSLCETLYGRRPEALLISVRGYEFGFDQGLSPATAELAQAAEARILDWLQAG